MNATDHDRMAEDRLLDMALAEHLGGEEPGRTPEEIVAALDAAPAGRLRSMRGFLEIAAAAVLLAVAVWGLPRFFAPAPSGDEVAAAEVSDERIRGALGELNDDDPEVRRAALLDLLRGGERTTGILEETKPEIVRGSRLGREFVRLLSALPVAGILGPEGALAFTDPTGPVERCRALVPMADRLRERGVTREESLLLGDGILAVAPWRETYDDGKHQKDLFALGKICEENRLTFLGGLFARMAAHPDPYVRLHGVADLEDLGAREFVDVARAATTDPDSRVRGAALSALAAFGDAGDAGLLARALDDTDRDVRRNAVREYGDYRVGDGEVRSLVLRALEDPDAGVRMAAATRIDEESDATALPHLRAAREKEKNGSAAEILDSAIRALADLEGRRRGVTVLDHRSSEEGGAETRQYRRITEPGEWAAFAESHGLTEKPELDFGRVMVLVVQMGRVGNCSGVGGEVYEDDGKLSVRFRGMWYQTDGGGPPPGRPWGLFVVPRSKKPVVFLENTAGIIGMPPVWTERARLPALD